MNQRLSARWRSAIGTTVILGAIVATVPGCGALGAMANPKVAWAVSDPAPMTVVVRRADAAASTAREVDRLLTSTPTNADSDWLAKVGPSGDDTKAHMKALGDHPAYKASKARVVASEVWIKTLAGVRSDAGKYPNLLAAVDTSLADQYAKIMAKKQEIADLRGQIAAEEDAADRKGQSEADKKSHKDKIEALDKQADAADDAVDPLQKDFLKAAKDTSAKSSADVKGKLGGAFVNLRQAVEDADIANGAAAVRYPLAAPGIKDAATQHIGIVVADILEEQTGKRPSLSGLQPGLTLDGSNVNVTLNGIGPSDLGKMSMVDLTKETVKREQRWVGHALGLLGDISKTKELLSFEGKVLDAVLDGFKAGGWQAPKAASIDAGAGAGGSGGAPGVPSMPSAPKLPGL